MTDEYIQKDGVISAIRLIPKPYWDNSDWKDILFKGCYPKFYKIDNEDYFVPYSLYPVTYDKSYLYNGFAQVKSAALNKVPRTTVLVRAWNESYTKREWVQTGTDTYGNPILTWKDVTYYNNHAILRTINNNYSSISKSRNFRVAVYMNDIGWIWFENVNLYTDKSIQVDNLGQKVSWSTARFMIGDGCHLYESDNCKYAFMKISNGYVYDGQAWVTYGWQDANICGPIT